jgi:hypothetical protein
MEYITSYRGRLITTQDITTIKAIIASNPSMSRRFISKEVCKAWNWRQSNGQLKDMICRSLLLFLESKDLIKQPPRKCTPPNPLAKRKKPGKVSIDKSPISGFIEELFPLRLEQVRRTHNEPTFNSLISEHHYLGYTQPVGEHLKYMAFSQDRPIACLIWGSSPWYIGARDRFIGWSREAREKNLFLIANNTRFLILPWIKVPCLASHLLALNRSRLSQDWEQVYNHPLYLAETFVDPQLYLGTCYKADNWVFVGQTTGRGKLSNSHKQVLSKKNVLVYPLTKDFRKELCSDTNRST